MFKSLTAFASTALLSGAAFAHPSVQAHAHPHDSVASFLTVETMSIIALVVAFGLAVSFFYGRRSGGK